MRYQFLEVFSGAKDWTIYADSKEEAWNKWENGDRKLESDDVDQIDIIVNEYDK